MISAPVAERLVLGATYCSVAEALAPDTEDGPTASDPLVGTEDGPAIADPPLGTAVGAMSLLNEYLQVLAKCLMLLSCGWVLARIL